MNLEDRISYRLAKVLYNFTILILCLTIGIRVSIYNDPYYEGIFAFLFLYTAMNLIREAAIYVVFGRKLSWRNIIKIIP